MSRKWILLGIFGFTLSAALKAYLVGLIDYRSDEMLSVNFALNSDPKSFLWDNTPPTYYFLLNGWLKLVPHGEFGFRSLNLLFSALTPLVAFIAARRRFGWENAFTFSLLFSFSALSVMAGIEVRVYGLLEMASIISLFLFDTAIKEKKISAGLASSWLLMVSLHYISLIFIAAQVLAFASFNSQTVKQLARKPAVLFSAIIGIPALLLLLSRGIDFQYLDYRQVHDKFEYFRTVFKIVKSVCVYSDTFVILFCVLLWRSSRDRHLQYVFYYTLILIFGCTVLSGYNLENSRYFIFLNPIIFWMLAISWERNSNRLNKALAAVLIALNFWSLSYLFTMKNAGWRDAGAIIKDKFSQATVAVLIPEGESFYRPYFQDIARDVRAASLSLNGRVLILVRQRYETALSTAKFLRQYTDIGWVIKARHIAGPDSFEPIIVFELELP